MYLDLTKFNLLLLFFGDASNILLKVKVIWKDLFIEGTISKQNGNKRDVLSLQHIILLICDAVILCHDYTTIQKSQVL